MPLKRNKSSGKDSTAASAFSEANCGLVTSEYYDSLQRRGSKYTMDTIAMVRRRQAASSNAAAEEVKPKGGRALLCKYFSLIVCSTSSTDTSDRMFSVFDACITVSAHFPPVVLLLVVCSRRLCTPSSIIMIPSPSTSSTSNLSHLFLY